MGIDLLDGGDGDNTIILPNGYLYQKLSASGGAGRDIYRFTGRLDTTHFAITDFSAGAGGDRLDLSALFVGTSGATLRVQQQGANALVQYDLDGAGPTFGLMTVATLNNVTASQVTSANLISPVLPPSPPPPPTPPPPAPVTPPAPVVPAPPGETKSGGTGSDVVEGTAGNDTVLGMDGADRIAGGAGADYLDGGNHNDVLIGGAGDDKLAGGSGTDTASYAGQREFHYPAQRGRHHGKDLTGAEGLDTLTGIERATFGGRHVALDIDGAGGQAYRIYQAAFNRAPDLGGLGFWLASLDKGSTVSDIAAGFMNSPEFIGLYGAAPSNEDLVARIYENVLHRKPDADGAAFWLEVLNSGRATRADVLAGFSESIENQAALVGVISQGIEYLPYLGRRMLTG